MNGDAAGPAATVTAVRRYGRAPSRLDPVAPDWLVRILSPRRAPVPWHDMARAALTLVVPLAVGLVVHQPGLGAYGSMGALVGALADRGGPRRDRVVRVAVGVLAGALGLAVGRVTAGTGAWAVVAVAAFAALSALVSSVSALLSFAALQGLVYVSVSGGLPATVPLPQVLVTFAAGGVWAAGASWAQSLVDHSRDAYRDAVVEAVRAHADLLREPGGRAPATTPTDDPGGERGPAAPGVSRRRALTAALDAAYDLVLRARAVSPGRRADLQALQALLTGLSPLTTAAVAQARTGRPAPDLAALVDGLAAAVARDDRRWRPPDTAADDTRPGDPAATATRPLLRAAVVDGVARAADALSTDRRGAGPAGHRARRVDLPSPRLLLGAGTWVFVARLTLVMAVAEVVRQALPLPRPYWVLLTAALVLKPDYGSVFARGVQRGAGTLVGVLTGALVLQLVPAGGWVLLPLAVFAALCPLTITRNYGLFCTVLTPLVLLLIDYGRPVTGQVVVGRLVDTLLGVAVVLVVGYALWPTTWRPRLGERVAGAVDVVGGFVRAAFGTDRPAAGAARRRAYRALSDVRAALQTSLAEPPPVSTSAAAWWPVIVQLERAADATTHAMVIVRDGDARVDPADVEAVAAALDDLAAALRGHRPPRDLPLPDRAPLRELAADVAGARRIAQGPAARRRRTRPHRGSGRRAVLARRPGRR